MSNQRYAEFRIETRLASDFLRNRVPQLSLSLFCLSSAPTVTRISEAVTGAIILLLVSINRESSVLADVTQFIRLFEIFFANE